MNKRITTFPLLAYLLLVFAVLQLSISSSGIAQTSVTSNINSRVNFEPIRSTFRSTPDASGCPDGFAGQFSFDAKLVNTSRSTYTDLEVEVVQLSNGNLLQNAQGGAGGVGSRLIVSLRDGYADGEFAPGEFVFVHIIICLKELSPFSSFFNIFGRLATISSPSITITQPLNGLVTNSVEQTVSGTISDQTLTSAILRLNGSDLTITVNNGRFSTSINLKEGVNTLSVSAQNTAGTGTSPEVQVTLDTILPTMELNLPLETAPPGGSVTASVIANDESGIADVILFMDGSLIDIDTLPPFEFPFSVPVTATEGSQLEITAKVTDKAGNIAQEKKVIKVEGDRDIISPTVELIAPLTATPGSIVRLQATAQDNKRVALFTLKQDDNLIRSVSSEPFTIDQTFTVPSDAAEGETFVFTASATDVSGNPGLDMLTITVVPVPDTIPPTVKFVKAPLEALPDTIISFEAEAMDKSGIVSVTFSDGDGFSFADTTAPYETNYTVSTDKTPGDTINLTATAQDFANLNSVVSTTITIIDNIPPKVTINTPMHSEAGKTFFITATAQDNVEVRLLNLNVGTRTLSDNDEPFEINHLFTVPSDAQVGEDITIKATAVDAEGNSGDSTVMVEVVATPDTEPPTVDLNAPSETFPGAKLRLSAEAIDNSGVSLVLFSIEMDSVISDSITISQAPFEAVFSLPNNITVGSSLKVSATATDFEGLTAIASKTLNVVAAEDNTAPGIEITLPDRALPGETVSINVKATDDVGVSSVSFYADGSQVISDTAQPFETTVTIPLDAELGTIVSIRVEATDFSNNVSTKTAMIEVTSRLTRLGNGFLTGEVYDDSTGLFLEGANVSIIGEDHSSVNTDKHGRYSIEMDATVVHLMINKEGFTKVYRSTEVREGLSTTVLDARLTPVDEKQNQINSALGGTATSEDETISLQFAAGALGGDQDIRVTSISGQGLRGRLPLGWTPLVSVEITPDEVIFQQPAKLLVPNNYGLSAGNQIV
ncbi:MAG: Ig-like domain-containing protein [Candidatus Scalindua sp.]|nr:Ig-like domain-containing protein [Candidatus Scalindua sp.]